MRRVALGVVLAGSLLAPYAAADPLTPGGIPLKAQARLRKEALAAAAKRGDRHPYDVQAVLVTPAQAQKLEDETRPGITITTQPESSRRIYFVAMRGRFAGLCKETPCSAAPVLMVRLSLSTEKMTGGPNGARSYPRLESVGVPVALRGSRRPRTTHCCGRAP